MKKAKAFGVSVSAVEYVARNPPPSYAEMDCYRFVRQCVRDNGGDMKYSGSNDVFRNGVTERMPLSDAIAKGALKSGWALFIVEPYNNKTPPQYLKDGLQDATHMGLYTDITDTQTGVRVEVAHSSSTQKMVAASTLKNKWNWAGKLKDVDYSDWDGGAQQPDTGNTATPQPQAKTAVVIALEGTSTANMRKTPDGEYMLKIPAGTTIPVLEQKSGSTKTKYNGYTGWVKDEYLSFDSPLPELSTPAPEPWQPPSRPGILSVTVDEVCSLRQSARDIIQMCDQLLAGEK